MDHEFQRTLLRRLFELRAARTTSLALDMHRQPAAHYTDPVRFEAERRRLFGARVLVAGLACELPAPGTYVTATLADVPVLMVRGDDGIARAFLNACRHRGAPVAHGRGQAGAAFKCPYHAWTYDRQGALRGTSIAREGFQGLDAGCTGLVSLPMAEFNGLLFVRPVVGGEPVDAEAELAGLAPDFAGHALGDYAYLGEEERIWHMNWKQPYETFLEAYHIFALHEKSLAAEVMSTPMLTETFGLHGRGLLTGRKAADLLAMDEQEWSFKGHANLVYWLFPNTVLSMPMTGHAELWQFYPHENSPDHARVHMRFYTPETISTEKAQAFWQRMMKFTLDVVSSEDFAQQEQIAVGLRSHQLAELIFGRNEPALIHFHQSIERALTDVGT